MTAGAVATLKNQQISSTPMFKRCFDISVSLILLPVLLPLKLAIIVAIKLDSPGPVFYRGVRTGWHGKPFRIFKFRTMVPDAERLGGGTTALADARITQVGQVLRRYKLDELPQLFNVLKGEMSLVGPRPELPQYTRSYNEREKEILSVRPGITDFSSIEFYRLDRRVGAEDADERYEREVYPLKNELRLKYVREQSLLTDLRILGGTFLLIFKRKAADGIHAAD